MSILSKKQAEQVDRQLQAYRDQVEIGNVSVPFGDGILNLIVDPFVASPAIMNSGVQIIQHMARNPELVRGKTVIDMGTGCGIIGIAAARLGAKKVIMTDIDERAVHNAQKNISKYGLENVCEAVQGDLFNSIFGGTKADVQIFNHPYFLADPLPDEAWSRMMLGGIELLRRYLHQAPRYSLADAAYLLSWFVLAGNGADQLDNDPAKIAPAFGYRVKEQEEQSALENGLQNDPFVMYELEYLNAEDYIEKLQREVSFDLDMPLDKFIRARR